MLFKRALALLVVALALPYACAPVYRFPPAHAFAGAHLCNPYAGMQGRWHRANLHAHGHRWFGLTSGRQTDEEVIEAYRAHGYDVAGISDYLHIAAHDGVTTMPLYEHGLNIGKHHQVAIGAHYVDWFDLPLWQGASQKQYIINRVRRSAELVALAHPSITPSGYSEQDLAQLTGYDLFEVVNGRFAADDLWDRALSTGHRSWAIGNDDTHDVTDPERMAVAWTMIDAPSASTGDIIAGLREGRAYAVGKTTGEPGPGDAVLSAFAVSHNTIDLTITAPAAITFIGQDGRGLKTTLNATTASYALAPGDSYVRTVVRTPHTVMYLNPVFRHDGGPFRPGVAVIDGPKTWAMRAVLGVLCAALLFTVFRRRPGDREASRRGGLRRASSFMIVAAVAIAIAAPAAAQSENAPPPPPDPALGQGPPLGSTLTFNLLRDLPTSDNLFSVLETTQAEIISDRFSGGGINFGTAARVGAFGSSWTQTLYRIGDVNVTDGAVGGAPLVFPEVAWWDRMSLASGVMPADLSTPGAAVTLEPRRPSATWTRDASFSTSFGDALAGKAGSLAVPISKLTGWNRASVVASGPLVPDRLGLFFAGSWTGASQLDRSNPNERTANVGSAFAHLLFTPANQDEIRTVAIVQRVARPDPGAPLLSSLAPARDDVSAHVQSTWQRRGDGDSGWRAFASFTQRSSSSDSTPFSATVVDRLVAGPVADLVATDDRTDRRWSLGGRLTPAPRGIGGGNHIAQFGADLTGVSDRIAPGFAGAIGELVGGVPARVWQYAPGTADQRHHATTFSAFASDRIQVPAGLLIDASLRYEWVGGGADGGANDIRWNMVLPRASVRWAATNRFGVALFGAYVRSAYQLPIDALSWGDPSAPTASIFRWIGAAAGAPPVVTGPLVGRWGPGTGGDPAFSSIDPNVKRPYSDDISIGIEAHPTPSTRVQLAGVAKWEKQLLGVVNQSTAAPLYSIVGVNDPGLDLAQSSDDQVLPVSNLVLNPGVPYRYQFVLTNPSDATARLLAVKFSAEAHTDKLFVLLGATAGMAEGLAAYQGFGPTENDQGTLGDVFVNPNAAIYPRGRLFNDRAFTIKLTTIYRFPWDVRLGAIARYQDGQPFSRLVIVPGLNQGAEAVRAFANGGSRFTFTGTLDVRLQKEFAAGGSRVAIVLDGYNIVNLGNEVEEIVVTGQAFRTPTAIQPPLAIHVGARVTF